MGLRIITDTSCDLPPALERELEELGVIQVPFLFHFGMETLRDKSLPMSEFLSRADQTWPTTAAPSVGTFAEVFAGPVARGDQVLCMTITGKHSACYSAARLASQQFASEQVAVVDSEALSLAQGLLVVAAARAAHAGQSLEQVLRTVREVQARLHLFIVLEVVSYLVRGGRASRLSAAVAGLLRLRPILTLCDGELILVGRPRGREAAKREALVRAGACFPAETVGVAHIECYEEAQELTVQIATQTGYPREQILLAETGQVLASHGGPGALGIVVISRPRLATA